MAQGLREYLAWQAEMGTDEVVLPRPLPYRSGAKVVAGARTDVGLEPPLASGPKDSRTAVIAALSPTPPSLDFFQNLGKTLEMDTSALGSPPPAPAPKPPESRNFPVFLGLTDYWSYLEENRGILFPGGTNPTGSRPLVRGTGPAEAPLALVGLAPGMADGDAGVVFQGPEGELLGKMLRAIRLDRQSLYCSTLVKEACPGRVWNRRELARLLPLFHIELGLARVSTVVLLGEACAQAVLKTGKPLDELRQRVHDLDGRQYLVTYHPEDLLMHEDWKRKAWEDLQWLQKRLPTDSQLPAGSGV